MLSLSTRTLLGDSIQFCAKIAQSCLTLCNPMDYIVHGILQARILEWVAIPFSKGSFPPRDRTYVSCIGRQSLSHWATREAHGFVVYGLIVVRYVPFMSPFWRFFSINWCWILSKTSSTSIEIIGCFLFFNLLTWYITLIGLQKSKNPHIPRINPTWSWYTTLLMYYYIWFAKF